MSASKLHPNIYKGELCSGGFLALNKRPTSAKAPDWKGRIYLPGVGWYWLSGWVRDGIEGPETLISLAADEMTDEQCSRVFSKSKANGDHSKPKPRPEPEEAPPEDPRQSDIPF